MLEQREISGACVCAEKRISRYKKETADKICRAIYFSIKRIADIVMGAAGAIALIPVCAAVKAAYLLEGDIGPVIYRQERIGKNGVPFKMYKFRSMSQDAEERLQDLLQIEEYRKEWKKYRKLRNDPRLTKTGSVLRKTSIDEFPQFINVLKGDMSIVGPRPLVEGELEECGGHRIYNSVKPGITGWWTCNGRSDVDYQRRLDLEYYYIENMSVKLDAVCLIKTVSAVISKTGAR